MTPPDAELRRRIRAAQALAGIKNIDELAERIGIAGLGRDTLYDMLRGKRPVRRHELREIAEACELPVEFFTVDDFAGLAKEANGEFDNHELEEHDTRVKGMFDEMVRRHERQHHDAMEILEELQANWANWSRRVSRLEKVISARIEQSFDQDDPIRELAQAMRTEPTSVPGLGRRESDPEAGQPPASSPRPRGR